MKKFLLIGPPGSGKIAFARRLTEALPPMSAEGAALTAWLHHGAGLCSYTLPRSSLTYHVSPPASPFRAPHHTVSERGLVGGYGRPGEVSLAHGGCLLLDELPEFHRSAIGRLRDALRAGEVSMITRLGDFVRLPARPRLLVASACPSSEYESQSSYSRRLADYASLLGIDRIVDLRLTKAS